MGLLRCSAVVMRRDASYRCRRRNCLKQAFSFICGGSDSPLKDPLPQALDRPNSNVKWQLSGQLDKKPERFIYVNVIYIHRVEFAGEVHGQYCSLRSGAPPGMARAASAFSRIALASCMDRANGAWFHSVVADRS